MSQRQRGAALVMTFFMLLILAGLALAVGVFSHNSLVSGRSQLTDKQAFYIAEAGLQKARQQLTTGGQSPGWGESDQTFGAGTYTVTTTDNGDSTVTITSTGSVPNDTSPVAQRQLTESDIAVTTSGGTNLSLGGSVTAISSGATSGNPASNAKDGSTATKWEANTNGSGSYLGMDFSSATSLNQIIVKENNFIDDLTIEHSDNGSTWTVASGLSVSSAGKTWTANFTATSHRYFRARFTDVPSSKKASVDEFESYSTTTSLGNGAVTTSG